MIYKCEIPSNPFRSCRRAWYQADGGVWTFPVPVPGKRTGLPIRQAGLQAHTKSANLGAARCFQWTRYIAAQCSAYPLTGCGKFPLLFLPL